MSEKRKPKYTLLLKEQGKGLRGKIEMYPASLWTDFYKTADNLGRDRFRLRVNGRWWPKGETRYITKTQVKELVFKTLES